MLGEVQYGGRVTDDFDKRLLNTFCRVWFHENMFLDNFKFYQGYTIPKFLLLADIKQHIENLPLVDTPEVGFCSLRSSRKLFTKNLGKSNMPVVQLILSKAAVERHLWKFTEIESLEFKQVFSLAYALEQSLLKALKNCMLFWYVYFHLSTENGVAAVFLILKSSELVFSP